jgi:NAD(P)-dependent dehydrogenase (short-subunit alcohol dehydrogenase family)
VSRVILVTGARRGIGLEAARQFVSRGAAVILAARDLASARESAEKIGATPLALDVTDDASIDAAVAEVTRTHGKLDVLVNNAAVLLDGQGDILTLDRETLRTTLEANVISPLRVAQAFLPLLRKSSDPRIVNVSSGAGQLDDGVSVWAPAYSISKTAFNMLTQQLSGGFDGVAVNSMCPGWCRTEMGGSSAPRSAAEGADTIIWLALDAPASLTGQFFRDRAPLAW